MVIVRGIVKITGDDVVTIGPNALVSEAATVLYEKRIGVIVVVSDTGLVKGVLSERDVVRAVSHWPDQLSTLVVSQLYTEDPITCTMQDYASEVLRTMNEKGFRHMPVVEHGRLLGLLSRGDLLKAEIADAQMESLVPDEYSTGSDYL